MTSQFLSFSYSYIIPFLCSKQGLTSYVYIAAHDTRWIGDCHIMKRWTKDARDILGPNVEGAVMWERSLPKSFRHNTMYVSALELVKMGYFLPKLASKRNYC
jgi:hypothetical protein